ncbi:MAG: protein kinase [Chitinivibrionales bacterium]|nr:protein kinase [Chitinivibrionales bacterium]MBD3357285.1 protein kinase [Chitinivibrionales bacterium]
MNKQDYRTSRKQREELYQRSLERTVPLTDPSSDDTPLLERTVADTDMITPPDGFLDRTRHDTVAGESTMSATNDTDFVHDTQFPSDLLIGPTDSGKRYVIKGVVGKGATGRIFAMRDNGLDRTVAVKLLDKKKERKRGRRGQFVHEARVTATLEHPNIMPVHDIGVTERGELYFTMKNVAGCSVGDAIRAAKEDNATHPEFASIDGRVRISLKVCDALSYAHSRGYIHQDIKPDNIMLGEHGEVLLLDWGSALSKARIDEKNGPGLVGTPAYMSPEQARRKKSDERSDVYCLGATLFHALLLRHPTWARDPDVFWEKKRAGIIDDLSPRERRMIPAALLDIANKALRVDADQRYQSIAELAEDLKRYQAGRAVTAHRDTLGELVLRWYKHNYWVFWVAACAVGAIALVGGLLLHERIQEVMTWDRFQVENFAYEHSAALSKAWEYYHSDDWKTAESMAFSDTGGWRIEDQALVGDNRRGIDNISFKQRLPGDIRVEWEATPLAKNMNLNCYIGGATRFDGYTFHLGGWSSPKNFVLTKGAGMQILDHYVHSRGLKLGEKHRFRMEKEGPCVRLYLDGEKLFDYRDPVHLSGLGHQRFGFENCDGNRIRIDNIKIYYHPLPLKVSPLVAANRYYQKGYFGEAREQYREICRTYPDNEIAPLALFNAARCLIRMDSLDRAVGELQRFRKRHPTHELVPLSLYEQARIHEVRAQKKTAHSLYRLTAKRYPAHPVLRTILFNMTTARSLRLDSLLDRTPVLARDSAFYARLNRDRRTLQGWARDLGLSLNRNSFLEQLPVILHAHYPLDSIVNWFPAQGRAVADLLYYLGHYERIVDEFDAYDKIVAQALVAMGDYRKVIDDYPHIAGAKVRALAALGRDGEIIRKHRARRSEYGKALIRRGRFDEVLNGLRKNSWLCISAARKSGGLREHLEEYPMHSFERFEILSRYFGRYDTVLALMEGEGAYRRDKKWGELYRRLLIWSGQSERLLNLYGDSLEYAMQCAKALNDLGRDHEILRRYPHAEKLCIAAYTARGEYDSIVRKYPEFKNECLVAEQRMGRYRELYERYPRRPGLRAQLLLHLGEFERIVRDFPDQTRPAAEALLAVGKYDELLRRYPHESAQCLKALKFKGLGLDSIMRFHSNRTFAAQHLYELGKYNSVIAGYKDIGYWYGMALVRAGREDEIPWEKGVYRLNPTQFFLLTHNRALLSEMEGSTAKADSLLALPLPFSYSWPSCRFAKFFLEPVLKELRGNAEGAVKSACGRVLNDNRYHFGQKLWYEAAFLTGRITVEQFLSQPDRHNIRSRLTFLKGLRHDLDREGEAAAKWYQATGNLHSFERDDLVNNPLVREFIRWRISELSGEMRV